MKRLNFLSFKFISTNKIFRPLKHFRRRLNDYVVRVHVLVEKRKNASITKLFLKEK
jgi:hypothetical protein